VDAILDSLDTFVRTVSECLPGDDWIFRGQPHWEMPLVPAIDRAPFRGPLGRDLEQEMFERFKRGARLAVEPSPPNDFEWLSLAHQYGLPTRLLDWTRNPMEALYFAVEDAARDATPGSSSVVGYHASSMEFYQPLGPDELARPFEIGGGPRLVDAVRLTHRAVGQRATFTLHPEPALEDRSLEWPGELNTFLFPNHCHSRLRAELRLFGVQRATLFPDLHGLAWSIRQYEHDALVLTRPPDESAPPGSSTGTLH
jgi:hypothetical protein